MSTIRSIPGPSGFQLHARQLQQRFLSRPAVRHASTVPPPKPRLLEKPERFNPPSHPARLRSKPKVQYAPLKTEEREAQGRRQYPHMMPPEGTFLHWFLTSRSIHMYITLGILSSLVLGMWYNNFVCTTPYRDLLPPNNMFFGHPIKFIQRYWEVYQMHSTYTTQQTMERRKRNVDDVTKRSEYRKAHGLDDGEKAGMFGGWTAKPDTQAGPAPRLNVLEASPTRVEQPEAAPSEVHEQTYMDFEGKPQRPKKMWFGIW